ncbi:MAG: IclR family transcriptional regulator [Proteobacteria bacterium]|nr:IclR family transcriptional regulator [Pseudomonadota bacterium]
MAPLPPPAEDSGAAALPPPTRPQAGGDGSPLFLNSVAKCFQLLETLNQAGCPLGLTELAARSGLDRSSVQRIAHTLRVLGYLRQDTGSKALRLSGRMLEFSHTVLATHQFRDHARPHLEALNRATRETVNLMELEGDDIVYVSRYPSLHAVSVDLHVGSRLPAFCTAAGRAIYACLEPADALARLKAARRSAMTPFTVTALPSLRRALDEARALGYALNAQEAFIGDISVAAPLLDMRGAPLAAVNIAVPTPRWQLDDVLRQLVPQLLKTAAAINRELRYL